MLKKLFLFLFALFALLLVVGYFYGSAIISKAIIAGVERFGPPITQTSVELDAVELSILSGNFTLRGLRVGNPEGYRKEHIFDVGEVIVDIDPSTVTSDTIIVNKVHILRTEMSYETGLHGSNVKQLQKNVEAFGAKAEEDTAHEETESEETEVTGRQVIIRELVVDDMKVYTGLMGAGIKVGIPRIEMHDIGDNSDDLTIAESISLILSEVIKSIGPAIRNSVGSVGEAGKSVTDGAVEGVKGLLGQ
ncbi:hypothetical protein [Coraliomargarita akajimensis]|uniref:AsmA domain-containing protein n=1 Tax=Coraliomargarita akajimensis (strain DSM 45221 / IAM 15411 / JCM 23193 / KCTC 12865 / 04OKA010-24) TaxID=583355 RepID=D5EMX6_CORAD|nr:hypothetical protein [Coraliomargarita akajimensis]ADE55366.1 conserved hypothetical protein [Coraliomargarita akajimensis DSM 45221]